MYILVLGLKHRARVGGRTGISGKLTLGSVNYIHTMSTERPRPWPRQALLNHRLTAARAVVLCWLALQARRAAAAAPPAQARTLATCHRPLESPRSTEFGRTQSSRGGLPAWRPPVTACMRRSRTAHHTASPRHDARGHPFDPVQGSNAAGSGTAPQNSKPP